ncbi:hypothetical protein BDA96_04G172500 [Sorghum bicolor]|uniref:Uncharacterized protein n=2 Tax=Sorghum bicolor TaxID=4558 RepID=A0A921UIA8_SORBI|nr:hypothetical protein BDA96_04G172500 [Sorghum bicolor]OQU85034.1 hypothetical protein SORBI_3004G161501 [Sorghum bicolor]
MAVLETLKPLEEKLGANIPREAKSCICVMHGGRSRRLSRRFQVCICVSRMVGRIPLFLV